MTKFDTNTNPSLLPWLKPAEADRIEKKKERNNGTALCNGRLQRLTTKDQKTVAIARGSLQKVADRFGITVNQVSTSRTKFKHERVLAGLHYQH